MTWTLLLATWASLQQMLEYLRLDSFFRNTLGFGSKPWAVLTGVMLPVLLLNFVWRFQIDFLGIHFLLQLTPEPEGSLIPAFHSGLSVLASALILGSHLHLSFHSRGSFNGGSDAMINWIWICITVALGFVFARDLFIELHLRYSEGFPLRVALYAIGAQGLLSYFVAGVVKAQNSGWWTGKTIKRILSESPYPVPSRLRLWSQSPSTVWPFRLMSWFIISFELFAPALLIAPLTGPYLFFAFLFHLLNWWLFGLNRFVWAWLASYPAIIFLVERGGSLSAP